MLRLELSAAVRVLCTQMDAAFESLYADQQQQQPRRASSAASANGSSGNSSTEGLLAAACDHLYVVHVLVASPAFRPSVVEPRLLTCLAGYLMAAASDDGVGALAAGDEAALAGLRASLLQVLEAVGQVRREEG